MGRDLRSALVCGDDVAVGLGRILDRNLALTLVGDYDVTVRLGGDLNVGSLALVSDDAVAVRLGRLLDIRSLTLEVAFKSILEGR